ncbi:fumarylacetoacetate hydrolase family protein [Nocardia sp. NPDC047038]|uniref:fumarylacetoacetate hydrolase family protein n=1 Tax=Nocardia sp. NPDC047038 TaxID=3154338 RepID=UPI0033EC5676
MDGRSCAQIGVDGGWHSTASADVAELLALPRWRESWRAAPESTQLRSAPLVRTAAKVICCGHNYRAHISEMGHPEPRHPTLFAKFTDTLTAWDADIVLREPAAVWQLDWEAELAVVVGSHLRRAEPRSARAAIAGYAVANDFSVRSRQRRTSQWLQGKAFEATTPLGPDLVTADEIDPADGLRISCRVNGVEVQDGCTGDLVFSPAELLSYISDFTPLRPGDVVLTGTPGGVGAARIPARYLEVGDVVETEIEGIGLLRNRIVA